MIETVAGAQPIIVEQAPAQPLGRKPKPVMVVPEEPLQMVETKHE